MTIRRFMNSLHGDAADSLGSWNKRPALFVLAFRHQVQSDSFALHYSWTGGRCPHSSWVHPFLQAPTPLPQTTFWPSIWVWAQKPFGSRGSGGTWHGGFGNCVEDLVVGVDDEDEMNILSPVLGGVSGRWLIDCRGEIIETRGGMNWDMRRGRSETSHSSRGGWGR